jgi:hypothetical protein
MYNNSVQENFQIFLIFTLFTLLYRIIFLKVKEAIWSRSREQPLAVDVESSVILSDKVHINIHYKDNSMHSKNL